MYICDLAACFDACAFYANLRKDENDLAMDDNKKKKILTVSLIALLALLIIGIIILCVVLANPRNSDGNGDFVNTDANDPDKIVPDYPPQDEDPNQAPMENDPGGQLETEEGGGAVNITYGQDARVDLSEGKVTLYCANPSKSTRDMVITLVLDNGSNTVICRSQRVTPGNQIKELPLDENAKEVLLAGGYNAKYVVGCYNPVSNEKDTVELETKGIVLTVVE